MKHESIPLFPVFGGLFIGLVALGICLNWRLTLILMGILAALGVVDGLLARKAV